MEQLINTEQVAQVLGVSKAIVANWRRTKVRGGPPFVLVGGQARYRPSDLEAWLRERTRQK